MTFGAPCETKTAGRVMAGPLALFPGQAGYSPAIDAVAMALGIAITLETLDHVEATRVACLGRKRRSVMRPVAGAAQEQHRRRRCRHAGLELCEKIRIARSTGI